MNWSDDWPLLPFLLQGLCMVVDEAYFHERRGLGLWERVGHPLDTLTVLVAFTFLLATTATEDNLLAYVGLGAFSSLFITKDEWVHARESSGAENWLHALLFVLHPVMFVAAGVLWWRGQTALLVTQTTVVVVCLCYQTLRWNIPWPKRK